MRTQWLGLSRERAVGAAAESTVSRKVNAERLVLLGWSRAILMQFAHPLIAAGVHEHSDFRATPWAAARRLRHTVRAMLALTFGDEAARERTVEGIRAIHRRVHGRLAVDTGPFPAGTRYSAEDPSLVLWVHATLLDSVPMFYELLVRPLSAEERDAYCTQAAWLAIALGARSAEVPRSWDTLQRYLGGVHASGELAVGAQARELAAEILLPRLGIRGASPATINRLLAVGTLPESIRRQYGFEWSSRDERALRLVVRGLRLTRRALPDALATWRAARRPGAGAPGRRGS